MFPCKRPKVYRQYLTPEGAGYDVPESTERSRRRKPQERAGYLGQGGSCQARAQEGELSETNDEGLLTAGNVIQGSADIEEAGDEGAGAGDDVLLAGIMEVECSKSMESSQLDSGSSSDDYSSSASEHTGNETGRDSKINEDSDDGCEFFLEYANTLSSAVQESKRTEVDRHEETGFGRLGGTEIGGAPHSSGVGRPQESDAGGPSESGVGESQGTGVGVPHGSGVGEPQGTDAEGPQRSKSQTDYFQKYNLHENVGVIDVAK